VPDSLEAFRELAAFLLALTAMDASGGVRITYHSNDRSRGVLGGWGGPTDPIPLRDGRHLRLSVSVELHETPHGTRLKVMTSSYQYQSDREGDDWICRYDNLRVPGADPHPQSHVQINAGFRGQAVPAVDLRRVHFPTGRMPLEGVIRLLAEQFGVPCAEDASTWRPVLAETERAFLDIAHMPLSGPGAGRADRSDIS
jgi:hypothetical protein